MIYLDNAATTGQKPETVVKAVSDAMIHLSVNAGRGSYAMARKAVKVVDECKNNILALSKIKSGYHVFFSPSATIALNQIILGIDMDCYSCIYVSPFEHNAVMRPLHARIRKEEAQLKILPFQTGKWLLDEAKMESMFLSNKPSYVFISLVSNTTGYILPVSKIVKIAHSYGAKVVVDCAQALGAIDVDYSMIDADAYVFAGHKTLYGPYGIAGIILKDSFQLSPGLFGGTGSDSLNLDMPSFDSGGLEPGSMNIPAVCGLNEAFKWITSVGVDMIQSYEANLINLFVQKLEKMDKVRLFMPPLESRSSIAAFAVEGYQSHDVGDILDEEYDIAVRTGYQCAPLVHDWIDSKQYSGIVRVSVSYFTTEHDIQKIVDAIKSL